MKEFAMLLGFSMGMVTGMMLYKYSACTKKIVDDGEKIIKAEAQKTMKKAEEKLSK